MIDTYKELNEKYFNNEITSEAICLVEHTRKTPTYGCYNRKKKSITIYDAHDEVESAWVELLAHEMIHKLLDDKGIECVHGKQFQSKAKELVAKGIMVTTKKCFKTSVKDKDKECTTKEEKLMNNYFLDDVKVSEKGRLFVSDKEFVESTYNIVRDICEDKSMSRDDIRDIIKSALDKEREKNEKIINDEDMEKTEETKPKEKRKTNWRDFIAWKQDKYGDDTFVAENIAENYEAYLDHNDKYAKRIKYNEYRKQIEFNFGTASKPKWEAITNVVYARIHSDIDNDLHISNRQKVEDAIQLVADSNRYHEVVDYFNSLMWDHKPRVETFFIDWLKADDTKLNREMTRLWFIAAVKRMLQPGCKFDNILITVGPQGSGKSWLVEKLSNGFGYETNIRIDKEQEYGQKLDNTWFAVFDELASLNKKEASDIKKWFSITMDTFRSPYARVPEVHKRHCIYYGTTNDDYFLRDYTDKCERRYWTIYCHQTKEESWEKFKNFNQEVIDQIWAEALELYLANTDVELDIKGEYYQMLEDVQQNFKTSNEDTIAETLENLLDQEYILDKDGLFRNDQDCISQMKGKSRDMLPNEHFGHINKIPSRQIKLILKEVLHDVRKHKYFQNETSGFSTRWRVHYMDGKIGTMCYGRINPIETECDNNKVDSTTSEELFFQ